MSYNASRFVTLSFLLTAAVLSFGMILASSVKSPYSLDKPYQVFPYHHGEKEKLENLIIVFGVLFSMLAWPLDILIGQEAANWPFKTSSSLSTRLPHLDISVSNGTGQCNFSGQRDRQTFFVPGQRDNGTEVPSLSRDKGTTGQRDKLKILPRDGTVRDSQNSGQGGPVQPKSGTGRGTKRDRAEKDVLKQKKGCSKTEKDVLKQERMF